MNRTEFRKTARANNLTQKQLVKLSLLQSEVYHQIKFEGAEDRADLMVELGDIKFKTRQMQPIWVLVERGLVEFDCNARRNKFRVTDAGWAIPCNSGAGVFICGCADADVMDEPNCAEPQTRFA